MVAHSCFWIVHEQEAESKDTLQLEVSCYQQKPTWDCPFSVPRAPLRDVVVEVWGSYTLGILTSFKDDKYEFVCVWLRPIELNIFDVFNALQLFSLLMLRLPIIWPVGVFSSWILCLLDMTQLHWYQVWRIFQACHIFLPETWYQSFL